jgi:hypothetical protein
VASKVVPEMDVDVKIEVMVKTADVVNVYVMAAVKLVSVTKDVDARLKVAKLTDATVILPLVLVRVTLLVLNIVEILVVVNVLSLLNVKVNGLETITVLVDSSVINSVVKDEVVVSPNDVLVSVSKKAGTLKISKELVVVSSVNKDVDKYVNGESVIKVDVVVKVVAEHDSRAIDKKLA